VSRPRHHAAIGRTAQERGDDFEAWFEGANAESVARGLVARLLHVGPPHRRTGPGGEHIVITGPGGADYQGTARDGRAIAMEAKSRSRDLRFAEVKPHQREDLDRVAAAGGVAALLYRWTPPLLARARTFVVPWTEVPWRTAKSADGTRRPSSIGPEALAAWEVHPDCLLHPLDARWRFYLAPLLAAPRVMRVPWSPRLDGHLQQALGAMRGGRAQEVSLEAGGVRLILQAPTGGAR